MSDGETVDNPFGAPEPDQVSPEQYDMAFDSLEEAGNVDISRILVLRSLSANFSLVGDDINTLILGGGELQSTGFTGTLKGIEGTDMVDRQWVLRRKVGDHEIVAVAGKEFVSVETYMIDHGEQMGIFQFTLPRHTEFRSTGNLLKDTIHTHAVDWRSGKAISYYPAVEPSNPKIQQGFAKVVQDGIKELLSVAPHP
jgi:hypothetical protein